MAHLAEILIPLGGMILVVLIVYFRISYRHKERMEMLKMGLTPPPGRGFLVGTTSLWLGLVTGGIGLALLLFQLLGYDAHQFLWGTICLFTGIGMIVYYRMSAPHREQLSRQEEEHRETLTRQIEASRRAPVMGAEIDAE